MNTIQLEATVRCPARPPSRAGRRENKNASVAPENGSDQVLRLPAGRSAIAADAVAWQVLKMVADTQNVPIVLMLNRSRCKAHIAHARQLAMYLVHVLLSRSLTEVGQMFGRDRTTVAHACAVIEDMRDDREFDDRIALIEEILGEKAATSGIE